MKGSEALSDSKVKKGINANPGISCLAKYCSHHCGAIGCTAQNVAIGTTHAAHNDETMCHTFKERQEEEDEG